MHVSMTLSDLERPSYVALFEACCLKVNENSGGFKRVGNSAPLRTTKSIYIIAKIIILHRLHLIAYHKHICKAP